jgi:energy-coupling factor transport system permease protein
MNKTPSNIAPWTLAKVLSLTIIAAVFGFIYLGWVQLWIVLQALMGPLAMDIIFGLWYSGAIFASLYFRSPGAALASAMVSVITQIFAGNPSGAIMLLTGLVQGSGSEAWFLASRYRRFGLPSALLAGFITAQFSFVYTWIRFSYGTLEPTYVLLMYAVRSASGVVLGGGLAYALYTMIRRASKPAKAIVPAPAEL